VVQFFPLFLLGALFGKVMEASGAAERLAQAIAATVGPANAMLAVVLACAVLTYGGVSLFVVAFAAWPLARALFALCVNQMHDTTSAEMPTNPHDHAAFGCLCLYREQTNPLQLRRILILPTH
jgi:TRAP-type C4-dicarboxylate transport system permease large subunit